MSYNSCSTTTGSGKEFELQDSFHLAPIWMVTIDMDWLYHPLLHSSNSWIALRCCTPKCRILCVLYTVFVVVVHPPLPSGVLLQQWHKKNVDVGKSDCRGPLFEVMAKFMLGTSQGLTEKGFATHHRPGGRRWAIRSQQGHTEGSLLALKQRAGMEALL